MNALVLGVPQLENSHLLPREQLVRSIGGLLKTLTGLGSLGRRRELGVTRRVQCRETVALGDEAVGLGDQTHSS